MANKGEDHALVADTEAPTEFALMANTESKVFNNSLCSNDCKTNNDSLNSKIKDLTGELSKANNYIYHYKLAVAQLEGRLVEYKEREVKYIEKIITLEMYRASNLKCIKTLNKELEELKLEKDGLDGKLAGLLKASKNLDNLIESQRSDKVKEGVGYNAVPPPAADLYLSPKKDLSLTGLPEFVDDTITDYSRPSSTVASTSAEGQNKDSSTSEDVASPNTPKPFVNFETPKKPQVKYAEQYRHSNKKPNVKGNQRNWNNLKSYQLGPEFVLNKKACFNCGDFSHLANDCRKRVQRDTTRSKKHTYKSPSHRSGGHRPHGAPMRPPHRSDGHRPYGPEFVLNKKACFNCGDFSHLANDCRKRVQRDTTRSQKHAYESPLHRSGGHRPHGSLMRPPHRSNGHRPHEASMRPSHRPTDHRLYGPSMNPMRPNMNSARPNRSFFIQAHSYENRHFLKSSACQPTNEDYYHEQNSCYNSNSFGSDQCQPPKYTVNHPIFNAYNDFLNSQNELFTSQNTIMEQMMQLTSMCEMVCQIFQKKQEEKRIEEKQASNARYWKIPACCNDDDDYDYAITPEETNNSLSMGDEHLDIILATKSDEVIKSSGEDLVPILSESKGIPDTMCDVHLVNNSTPLEAKDHFEIVTNANNDISSSDDDSLYNENIDKPHDESSTKIPEGSGNSNPTASSSNPPADQMETLTVESPIPTVSSPVPTACLNDSLKPFSEARLISKRVAIQEESPSLDNILSLTNRFEDILGVTTSSNEAIGVEADVSNMETTISASPTPTLRIYKDHTKSQIIGPVDTPIQTKHKSKEVEE
nr:hypothetical protein [Tanacetum cinerariifolium]